MDRINLQTNYLCLAFQQQTTLSLFYTLMHIVFSFLQLRKQDGAVLKQPHFELMSMVLYPRLQPFPSSTTVSCSFLFLHFSRPCIVRDRPPFYARMAAARGNGFVPHSASWGRGRRGSLTPSKGCDFIPNTYGWDERA